MIDCQRRSPLLESLGAREMPRRAFLRRLATLVNYPEHPGRWNVET
jgi:leucyl/phenylalanyl-tRNA--protein transferase